jgi:hypothetical protein
MATDPGSAAAHAMAKKLDGLGGFYGPGWPSTDHYKVAYGPDQGYYVQSGDGYTYTWAATIYGIGLQAETDHSTDTWQEIDFGNAGARTPDGISGHNDRLHWLWGNNAKANVLNTPSVFYNY